MSNSFTLYIKSAKIKSELRGDNMKNKYNLSKEENIFLAKRLLVDSIWKSANLEGIAVTFPQTDTILNGINVSDIKKVNDIIAINNLKHAWMFILDNLDYQIDLKLASSINKCVGEHIVIKPGYLRDFDVRIGGTEWKPEKPNQDNIIKQFYAINNISNATEQAIETMLYIMRTQMFYDGNKRTAMLAANQIMIKNGAGIISIPISDQIDFISKLIKFYETNNKDDLKDFIYNKCIEGITFERSTNRKPTDIDIQH